MNIILLKAKCISADPDADFQIGTSLAAFPPQCFDPPLPTPLLYVLGLKRCVCRSLRTRAVLRAEDGCRALLPLVHPRGGRTWKVQLSIALLLQ